MTNLYDILEIPKNASDKEIRSAYKKLAQKHHPDKGGNEEKFKKISHAYEILSNKQQKEIYDQFGEEGLKNGGGNPFGGNPFPFDNIFGNIFRQQHQQQQQIKKCGTLVVNIEVTLDQIYNGDKIMKSLDINKLCNQCKGSGLKQGSESKSCHECHGRGIKIHRRHIGPNMIQEMHAQCDKCNGGGKYIEEVDRCEICNGMKVTKITKKFEININSQLRNNQQLLFKNQGEEKPDHEKGDIMFMIIEKEHPIFKRTPSNDLFMKMSIKLVEALVGAEIMIEHLDKRKIYIGLNGVIKHNINKKVLGEGIIHGKSDLIIEFDIEYPNYVDKRSEDQLEMILSQKCRHYNNDNISILVDNINNVADEQVPNQNPNQNEGVQCHQQ